MKSLLLACAALAALPACAQAEATFKIVKDPMTDVERGIAILDNTTDIMPVVKCDKSGPGSLYISLIAKTYVGSVQYKMRPVKLRFDDAAPFDIEAYHDDDSANFFNLESSAEQRNVLEKFRTSSKVVIQIRDYDYRPTTAVITLQGARDAIDKAIATCKDTTVTPADAAPAETGL